jgi:hypothetical protein
MLIQILEYHVSRLFPNFQGIALFTFVAPQEMGIHRSDGWQISADLGGSQNVEWVAGITGIRKW